MPTPPLPWNDEQLAVATVEDLRQIPEDVRKSIHTLDHSKMGVLSAMFVVLEAQRHHDRRLARERQGLPPAPPKPLFKDSTPRDAIVQLTEDHDWEDVGYYLYRTAFGNDDRYMRWIEEFQKRLDRSMEESCGGAGLVDRIFLPICAEPDLNELPWDELQQYHRTCQEDNSYGDGVVTTAFLRVDDEVIASLLEPKPNVPPWVWVVDAHFDFSDLDSIPEEEYRGYFKVDVDSLLSDMFPMCVTGMSLEELWAACPFDEAHPVWTNAFGLD